MSVVISSSLVLSRALVGDAVNGNSPIIGYENRVTVDNIETTSEDPNFPATNLANVATHELWKGISGSPAAGDEYITITTATSEEIDYVGIANHNLGSGLFPVSVEVQAGEFDSFVEVISDRFLVDDKPVIFRFTPQAATAVRVKIQASQAAVPVVPEAAVVYVGKLLVLQRRIYVGHTPIPYGRNTQVINGKSESGNFLGRIIVGETRSTGISMSNMTPAWYRTYMDPFVVSAQSKPFFFNWRPLDYPEESGFCWVTDEPRPSNQRPNGMMQIAFQMNGIV